MPKTLRTDAHAQFVDLLLEARRRAGLTQKQVADRLGRPQSFVAKYEGGERRLDVLEFVQVARAIEADPATLFRSTLALLPLGDRQS